jgi:hypothetical protein
MRHRPRRRRAGRRSPRRQVLAALGLMLTGDATAQVDARYPPPSGYWDRTGGGVSAPDRGWQAPRAYRDWPRDGHGSGSYRSGDSPPYRSGLADRRGVDRDAYDGYLWRGAQRPPESREERRLQPRYRGEAPTARPLAERNDPGWGPRSGRAWEAPPWERGYERPWARQGGSRSEPQGERWREPGDGEWATGPPGLSPLPPPSAGDAPDPWWGDAGVLFGGAGPWPDPWLY